MVKRVSVKDWNFFLCLVSLSSPLVSSFFLCSGRAWCRSERSAVCTVVGHKKKWMMTQFLLHDGDRQHLQGWRCWWWKVRFLPSVGLTTACRLSLGPWRTIVSTHCGRSARADPPWRLQSSQQATQPPWPLHNHSPTLAAHANTQTHVPACLRERTDAGDFWKREVIKLVLRQRSSWLSLFVLCKSLAAYFMFSKHAGELVTISQQNRQ